MVWYGDPLSIRLAVFVSHTSGHGSSVHLSHCSTCDSFTPTIATLLVSSPPLRCSCREVNASEFEAQLQVKTSEKYQLTMYVVVVVCAVHVCVCV